MITVLFQTGQLDVLAIPETSPTNKSYAAAIVQALLLHKALKDESLDIMMNLPYIPGEKFLQYVRSGENNGCVVLSF